MSEPAIEATSADPRGPAPSWLYNMLFFTLGRLMLALWRVRYVNTQVVPAEGPVILAANHRAFLDPFVVGLGLSVRRPVRFMAKVEMFRKQPLKGFLLTCNAFPVSRGTADRTAIRAALNVLDSNGILGMFPEGTRLHEGEEASPQQGVAFIALRSRIKVIPVGLVGTDKIFPGGRKLPAFPQVTVAYGDPIDPADFERLPKHERLGALTQAIMQGIDSAMGVADQQSRSR